MSFICSYLEHLHLVCCATHFERPLSRILRLSLHEHLVIVSVPLTPYLLRNAFRATPVEDSAFWLRWALCNGIYTSCTLFAAQRIWRDPCRGSCVFLAMNIMWTYQEHLHLPCCTAHFERPLSKILRFYLNEHHMMLTRALASWRLRKAFWTTPVEDSTSFPRWTWSLKMKMKMAGEQILR